jgi:O-antigen/teichoic acid export membrane protein
VRQAGPRRMSSTRGFLLGAGAQGLNLLGAMVSRVLIWRLLGVEAYGGVAFSLNLVTVISRSLSPGIAPATQYWAAKTHAHRDDVARVATTIGVVVAAVLVVGTYAAMPLLARHYFPADSRVAPTFAWLALGIFPVVVTSVLASLLLAWTRFGAYNLVALVTGIFVPVIMLLATLVVPPVTAVVAAHLVCWFAAAALALVFTAGPVHAGRWNGDLVRPMLKFALQSWPNIVMSVGAARLVSVVGLAFVGDVQFGFYILAVNVTEALFAMFAPIGQILFTRVSNSEAASFAVVARSMRLAVLTFTLLSVGFILAGKPVLLLVLGDSAAPAWPIALIVLGSAGAHAIMRIMTSVLAGMGRPTLNTVALGVEIAVLALCIVPLGMRFGATGLAVCGVIGAAAALLVNMVQLCRVMHVGPITLFVPSLGDVRFAMSRVGEFVSRRRNSP